MEGEGKGGGEASNNNRNSKRSSQPPSSTTISLEDIIAGAPSPADSKFVHLSSSQLREPVLDFFDERHTA